MSYSLLNQPAVSTRRRQQLIWLNRWLSVACAVALCHSFQWTWLCALTQRANLALDSWFGVIMQPLTATTIEFHGVLYQYQVSCTFADVWCGLVPLIWMRSKSGAWNAAWLALWAIGLFVFNIARLSLSDLLFAHGMSWALAHSVLGGVCYYVVWVLAKPFVAANLQPDNA
jgi:hypothetical protein